MSWMSCDVPLAEKLKIYSVVKTTRWLKWLVRNATNNGNGIRTRYLPVTVVTETTWRAQ